MRVLGALTVLLLATPPTMVSAQEVPPPGAGASYAWVTFDRERVTGAGALGLADRPTRRALTVDQPVRIASISKLAVALGVMRLVEEGRLDLDEDVSRLLGWQLRNPAFPDRAITLRLLLSHRAGLQDRGERYSAPLGATVRSLLDSDNAFDPAHPPGAHFRYANLNFPVIASLMEAATGERFDRLMLRLVIKPLGLRACFGWATCDRAQVLRGVTLYKPNGSVRHDGPEARAARCPVVSLTTECSLASYVPGTNGSLFSPQGGLRISARDLATIGRMMLNRGKHRGASFLRQESISEMTRPAWRFDGANGDTASGFFCAYGLGVQSLPNAGCHDDLFVGGRQAFGHAGEAYGLLSGLWMDARRGRGVVYFITNYDDAGSQGVSLFLPLERQLAAKVSVGER
jgi:CubicO group peptidase (beta-lactamase class C family)